MKKHIETLGGIIEKETAAAPEHARMLLEAAYSWVRFSGKHRHGKDVGSAYAYKKAGGVPLVPKADGKCTGCGLCAEGCPAGAISREGLKTADSRKCIACMRCVARCPQSARKVNGALVSAASLAIKKACSERKEAELFF